MRGGQLRSMRGAEKRKNIPEGGNSLCRDSEVCTHGKDNGTVVGETLSIADRRIMMGNILGSELEAMKMRLKRKKQRGGGR